MFNTRLSQRNCKKDHSCWMGSS